MVAVGQGREKSPLRRWFLTKSLGGWLAQCHRDILDCPVRWKKAGLSYCCPSHSRPRDHPGPSLSAGGQISSRSPSRVLWKSMADVDLGNRSHWSQGSAHRNRDTMERDANLLAMLTGFHPVRHLSIFLAFSVLIVLIKIETVTCIECRKHDCDNCQLLFWETTLVCPIFGGCMVRASSSLWLE